MATVTAAQKVRVGGSPVAHLVTQDGTAVSLGYTPTGGRISPAGPSYSKTARQGKEPLIVAEARTPAELRFSHTLVDPSGGTVDGALRELAGLVDDGEVVRLIGASGLETTGWWLIDDMQITVKRRDRTQRVMQAEVSWTLLPYVKPKTSSAKKTAGRPPAKPAKKKSSGTGRTHTVVRGDTLWAIAAKYLGSGSKYPEIARLNHIKNPNLIYPGTVLKIPAG